MQTNSINNSLCIFSKVVYFLIIAALIPLVSKAQVANSNFLPVPSALNDINNSFRIRNITKNAVAGSTVRSNTSQLNVNRANRGTQQTTQGTQGTQSAEFVDIMVKPQQQQHDYPTYQPLSVDKISSDEELTEFESKYKEARQLLEKYKKDKSFLERRKILINHLKTNKGKVGSRRNQNPSNPERETPNNRRPDKPEEDNNEDSQIDIGKTVDINPGSPRNIDLDGKEGVLGSIGTEGRGINRDIDLEAAKERIKEVGRRPASEDEDEDTVLGSIKDRMQDSVLRSGIKQGPKENPMQLIDADKSKPSPAKLNPRKIKQKQKEMKIPKFR